MAFGFGGSSWQKRVAAALGDPRILQGISQAVAAAAKRHIAKSEGRGPGGSATALKPLKSLDTEFWTKTKPKQGPILGTRKRVEMRQKKAKDGRVTIKPTEVTEYLVKGKSYRDGGQPLRDTGNLVRNLGARTARIGATRLEITLTGPKYAIYHELGFETTGPNYVPLTRKGVRQHATGQNPDKEGLARGKDFLMAWGGVKVPARPFLVPTDKEWAGIGRTIRLGLSKVLKGRTN